MPFLAENYDVMSFSREELDLNDGNAVKSCLHKHQFDIVIHTATYDAAPKDSPKDPNKVLENNLRMFFNIARNRNDFGKMLFFGSGAEFGRENWTESMSERCFDQSIPQDQYGYSKYLMTQFAMQTSNIFNLRLFGVFGELDDWRYRFLSNICCHAVLNQSINVHQNSLVDFLYVNDLARIVIWFIEKTPSKQVYNVCRGKAYEFSDLAERIKGLTNDDVKVSVKYKDIGKRYGGINQDLLTELGEFEFTPMEQSLKNMLDWYTENRNLIDVKQFHF